MARRSTKNTFALILAVIGTAIMVGGWIEASEKPVPKRPLPNISNACNPEKYTHLIGQDKSVLDGMTLPEKTRILGPGMARTMDYFEGRLNIFLDKPGKIKRIACG